MHGGITPSAPRAPPLPPRQPPAAAPGRRKRSWRARAPGWPGSTGMPASSEPCTQAAACARLAGLSIERCMRSKNIRAAAPIQQQTRHAKPRFGVARLTWRSARPALQQCPAARRSRPGWLASPLRPTPLPAAAAPPRRAAPRRRWRPPRRRLLAPAGGCAQAAARSARRLGPDPPAGRCRQRRLPVPRPAGAANAERALRVGRHQDQLPAATVFSMGEEERSPGSAAWWWASHPSWPHVIKA